MTFDKFDVYPVFIEDTARLSDRRQTTNNIYLSVNSVLLGVVAFLAQQGHLESFTFLIIEVFVAAAGFIIASQWHHLLRKYRELLSLRYRVLEEIENLPEFPGVAGMYAREHKENIGGFSDIEARIPRIFQGLYAVGSVALIAGTFIIRLGLVSHLISAGILSRP